MYTIFIGDIAGQYDALQNLVAKLPSPNRIILLGDLVDRGPKSKEVIEWAMTTSNVEAVRGNHEDMFISYCDPAWPRKYNVELWINGNGGFATLKSYDQTYWILNQEEMIDIIPKQHIEYLKSLPLFIESDTWIASHAPWYPEYSESDKLWHRSEPSFYIDKLQIHGHNSHWGLRVVKDNDRTVSICLDQSRSNKLTAYVLETKEIIEEEY